MKLFEKISSSLSFDKLVKEQRQLTTEIRQQQEAIHEAKTHADKSRHAYESSKAEQQLGELKKSFADIGAAFYDAADIVKEMGLRAKLEADDLSKEDVRQARADLKALGEKKQAFERGVGKKIRSWEVFQLRYWGLTGRAVRWLTGISGGALFMKGWKEYYQTGITAQTMQLETVGKLDEGLTTWGGSAASFSLVKSEIEGTLRKYGISSGVDVDDLTKRLISYSGADRDKAEKLFSSLASTARIAQMDFKEIWDLTEKRSRKYNRDLGEVASEYHEIIAIADGTAAEVEKQDKAQGETQKTRGIFRKEYLQSILSVTNEIEDAAGYSTQIAVAKLFSSGVVEANNLKGSVSTTLTTAKAYTKFLHLDEVYNYQLGINVVARIDAEVEKKMRGRSALESDRVTREVILNLAGKDLAGSMQRMYEVAKEGGILAAPDIGKLWAKTSEGSMEAARINYDAVSGGSSDYGIQLLVTAGMSREEAITAVIAVKAGHIESLNPVQKQLLIAKGYEQITAENSESYQEMITSGAKSIFGSITSTVTQVWGSPLVRMAAGLGVMAYIFRKEVKGAFATVASWASLAASYMRWAGMAKIDEAKGTLSSLLGKVKGVGGKRAALIAGAATVAAPLALYGVGKAVESFGKGEDPKEQAKKMVPSTPLGNELEAYVSKERIGDAVDPKKVGDMVTGSVTKDTERLTNQVVMNEAMARERALKKSVVESLGGKIVQRNGREVAEVQFPKFMADAIQSG
jgi:hypothetical protein